MEIPKINIELDIRADLLTLWLQQSTFMALEDIREYGRRIGDDAKQPFDYHHLTDSELAIVAMLDAGLEYIRENMPDSELDQLFSGMT